MYPLLHNVAFVFLCTTFRFTFTESPRPPGRTRSALRKRRARSRMAGWVKSGAPPFGNTQCPHPSPLARFRIACETTPRRKRLCLLFSSIVPCYWLTLLRGSQSVGTQLIAPLSLWSVDTWALHPSLIGVKTLGLKHALHPSLRIPVSMHPSPIGVMHAGGLQPLHPSPNSSHPSPSFLLPSLLPPPLPQRLPPTRKPPPYHPPTRSRVVLASSQRVAFQRSR